jgi:PII-like signaling protein
VPVVGVIEAGVRAIRQTTTTGRVGVVGTTASIRSGVYQRALTDLAVEAAAAPGHAKIEGRATMMRIYVGEADQWHDKPLYEALLSAMRAHDLAGATVYRGILGYGATGKVHKELPFDMGHDVSMMISVIDSEQKIESVLPLLDQMIQQGSVVLSDVDVIKYTHRAPDGTEAKR